MAFSAKTGRRAFGGTLAAALVIAMTMASPTPLGAAPGGASQPSATVNLSTGRGTLVNLSAPMSDLFVADDKVADVQVRSATQLYIFGKAAGETTIYATSRNGKVVYAANVRVGTNIGSIDQMMKLAMPDATVQATPMNGMVLLTGTVANPDDVAEAERLAQAFVGQGVQVVSRLRTATPLQVNLQVRIAEVNRDFAKEVGFNLLSRDTTGGFLFGIASGRPIGSISTIPLPKYPELDASSLYGLPAGSLKLPFNTQTGQFITNPLANGGTAYNFDKLGVDGKTALGFAGKLFGVDVMAALDLAEKDGAVTTLANPNLTALSGETASFLAGGEIPVPINQGLGAVSVEFKQYGVSLAFTPTVLADGRISMRVRPEVSQLSSAGAVQIGGFTIPGLTTRRAETTVELGSGQSFMIGGLLSNSHNNSMDKAPFLGDLPILGALFRSKKFRRTESELMIVVTPYLVKPVSANQIALPTDGYKAPTDAENFLLGQSFEGKSGEKRPMPQTGKGVQPEPGLSPVDPQARGPAAPQPLPETQRQKAAAIAPPSPGKSAAATAKPGFTFD